MLTPQNPDDLQPPTLGRAIMGFLASLALVAGLFFLFGHAGRPDADVVKSLAGTFGTTAATVTAPVVAPGSEYTFRFLAGNRVEVQTNGRFFDAYYHVENDQVFVETAESRGRNRTWRFAIAGDRLIGGGIVLTRR